mgnify:CR=1 FL=1
MKAVLVSIGFLIALGVVGAGGFLVGYQQYEKSLAASPRSPEKLEMKIATVEQEKEALQQQVSDLQEQVKSGVKTQAEASKTVAELQQTVTEQKAELEQAREKLLDAAAADQPASE